jgi:hypothetical protein
MRLGFNQVARRGSRSTRVQDTLPEALDGATGIGIAFQPLCTEAGCAGTAAAVV